jgi:hypothetical protein
MVPSRQSIVVMMGLHITNEKYNLCACIILTHEECCKNSTNSDRLAVFIEWCINQLITQLLVLDDPPLVQRKYDTKQKAASSRYMNNIKLTNKSDHCCCCHHEDDDTRGVFCAKDSFDNQIMLAHHNTNTRRTYLKIHSKEINFMANMMDEYSRLYLSLYCVALL